MRAAWLKEVAAVRESPAAFPAVMKAPVRDSPAVFPAVMRAAVRDTPAAFPAAMREVVSVVIEEGSMVGGVVRGNPCTSPVDLARFLR
jgi:hypothetical protein